MKSHKIYYDKHYGIFIILKHNKECYLINVLYLYKELGAQIATFDSLIEDYCEKCTPL